MMSIKERINKRVGEIARSLLSEEYRILVRTQLPITYFVKLRHRVNRNQITILGNYQSQVIRLIKNGRTIKEEHFD